MKTLKIKSNEQKANGQVMSSGMALVWIWHSRCKSGHTRNWGWVLKQSALQLASRHCPAARLLHQPTFRAGAGGHADGTRQEPQRRSVQECFRGAETARSELQCPENPRLQKGDKNLSFSRFFRILSVCVQLGTWYLKLPTPSSSCFLGAFSPHAKDSHLKTGSRKESCAGQMGRHRV